MLKLNRYDARRLLAHQHFTEADLKTVFKRLGSVQFDPLNPVGRIMTWCCKLECLTTAWMTGNSSLTCRATIVGISRSVKYVVEFTVIEPERNA